MQNDLDTEAAFQIVRNMDFSSAHALVEKYNKPLQELVEPKYVKDYGYDTNLRKTIFKFFRGELNGRTSVELNAEHIYTTRKKGTELWLNRPDAYAPAVCVAKKVKGFFVGNASGMNAIATGKGRTSWSGSFPLKIQLVLEEYIPMIPFRLFKDLKLNLDSFELIDKGEPEKIDIGQMRKGKKILTHYTGAMLFSVGNRSFLFDIDRNDLKKKNFNAFLSQLREPAESIAEAYANLKPKEVVDAERFMKAECPRQGEWFFIPAPKNHYRPLIAERRSWQRGRRGRLPYKQAVLQSDQNRAHYVSKISAEGFVTGRVTHGGHEHLPIVLDRWYKPVANTAVESFKITGAID